MRCASCGQENPEGFRFCGRCGAALLDAPAPREVRKVVTVVFCDLTGSTALGERTDPEALRTTMRGYYEQMRAILERHGGTVEKFVGDAVMAVFGVPVAHEDDALRAVRAAWEMRSAVPSLGLEARIGVNTGEVVAGEGDTLVTGDAVNIAARLEQAAEPGDVLIGNETARLVRGAIRAEPADVAAKGKSDPVRAYRLAYLDPSADAIARRQDTPLVGRTRELGALRHAFERAMSERTCHLFTLIGPAGVGKSRLTAEFLRDVDARVLRGRCLDYGEGITFWPLVEVLKQLGDRADGVLELVVGGVSSPNELFRAVRTELEAVASERPLVVVFEDLQWAEPTFLDLLDHVADLSRGAPILLLCLARHELLDARPGWGGGKLNATTVLLEALSPAESEQLVDRLGDGFDARTRERVLASAAGNPLFLEEMLALARETGDVGVPSSIHALLQARLDRLGVDERSLIERGAVEGEVFHRSAVHELASETTRTDVEMHLAGLVRKELIRPTQPTFPDDDAYRFRHLLIRDAAYDALPKHTRAQLHERFATWLELNGDLVELDEIVGYHLEQAHRYAVELGRADAPVAARAGRRLAQAGRNALSRSDWSGAVNLLDRALALLEEREPLRPPTLLALVEALHERGDFTRDRIMLEEVERTGNDSERVLARLMAARTAFLTNPREATAQAETLLAEVVPQLEPDDHIGRYWAAAIEHFIHWMGSRGGPALTAIRTAIEQARRAGDRRLEGALVMHVASAVSFGTATLAEMEETAQELERRADHVPAGARAALMIRIFAAMYDGRLDEARGLHDSFERATLDVGETLAAHITRQMPGLIEVRAGRPERAIEVLEPSYSWLREQGVDAFASTHAAYLAVAYQRCGRLDDALRSALESEEISAAEDIINFAIGRGARARVHADRGEHDAAERLAREALGFALTTDFPLERGSGYLDLAYVLAQAGRPAAAREAAAAAIAEFEVKGDAWGVAEANRLLVEL